jgi:bacteriocin resistance YdeI/OmpD-like protein/uncharacterized protein DUF1905
MGRLVIDAKLESRGPAAAVILDEQQAEAIGEGARRFPVVASVNGYSWRTTVTRMRGEFLLGFNRAVREVAGVQIGEKIEVAIELDSEPREVEVPPALAEALVADSAAAAAYDKLSYTHRREYARWVAEAKREETRTRRVTAAIRMLREGKRFS